MPRAADTLRLEVSTRTPPELPRAALFHYWHPDRPGIELCPAWFAAEVALKSDALRVHRPPPGAPTHGHPWLVWYRKPEVTHPLSPGWFLLRIWWDDLDSRLLTALDDASARKWGDARQYFDHVAEDLAAAYQAQDRERKGETLDRAFDFREYTKIKNIGRGSKFALHHDGTLIPSRGELNWQRERE